MTGRRTCAGEPMPEHLTPQIPNVETRSPLLRAQQNTENTLVRTDMSLCKIYGPNCQFPFSGGIYDSTISGDTWAPHLEHMLTWCSQTVLPLLWSDNQPYPSYSLHAPGVPSAPLFLQLPKPFPARPRL